MLEVMRAYQATARPHPDPGRHDARGHRQTRLRAELRRQIMRALSIAATGMQAQQTNVEVIANNLANMNTAGFKRQRAEFEDLLYQNVEQPGAQSSDTGTIVPSGIQLGVGVRTAAVYRVTSQGDLQSTSNPVRSGDPGLGLFPYPDAGRHRRLHARRIVSAFARRPDRDRQGLHRGARHRRSADRDLRHRQRAGTGAGARSPARRSRRRSASSNSCASPTKRA